MLENEEQNLLLPRPNERRKFARLDLSLKAGVGADPKRLAWFQSSDISLGGAKLFGALPDKVVGDDLEIFLKGRDSSEVKVLNFKGRVVEVAKGYIRVKFIHSSDVAFALLQNWLQDYVSERLYTLQMEMKREARLRAI